MPLLLQSYTYNKGKSYDPDFDEKIRRLKPDWFVTRSDKADEKKRQLLKLKERPRHLMPLWRVLCKYTTKSSGSYDPDFDEKIRRLKPDWFVTRSDKADEKKRQLLKLKERPQFLTKLGDALYSYTKCKRSAYDSNFDKKIRKLRPEWFKNR